jgi:hypothetical protein
MALNWIRGTALVLALALAEPALAADGVFRPSPRALAQGDEPPPHANRGALKQATPKAVVVADEDAPVYKKWWFWAVTAAVVGATVAYGALSFKPAEARPRACPLSTRVCFGDGRLPQ